MASEAPAGITRETLADKVYDLLLGEILSGKIEPGSKLLTAHLASRFGSSLAPVREAISRLSEEGLVVTEPFIGTVIKEPTWKEFKEIYLLRQELEAYAVRLIMNKSKIKFDDKHPARKALEKLGKAAIKGNGQEIIEADLEFHRAVCEIAESPLTLEVWNTIIKRFRGARISFQSRRPDDMHEIYNNHKILLDVIETGNAAKAEKAFRDHLIDAMERLQPKS